MTIGATNRDAIDASDHIIALPDGTEVDSGVAAEFGCAEQVSGDDFVRSLFVAMSALPILRPWAPFGTLLGRVILN